MALSINVTLSASFAASGILPEFAAQYLEPQWYFTPDAGTCVQALTEC
jgi:hypothetical protein